MVVTKDYKMLPGFNQLESYSICIETHIHVIYYYTQRNTSDLPIDVIARLFQSWIRIACIKHENIDTPLLESFCAWLLLLYKITNTFAQQKSNSDVICNTFVIL